MKKMILVSAVALVFTTGAFAASDINVHESVNNSSSQAHQSMIKKDKGSNKIAATTSRPNQHEEAAVIHESMKNGNSPAHQDMAEQHKKMMGNGQKTKTVPAAESFNDMSEHEKAAVIHENMNNGHSGSHQQMADDHLKQDN